MITVGIGSAAKAINNIDLFLFWDNHCVAITSNP